MPRPKNLNNLFSTPVRNTNNFTDQGNTGFDNVRENIDPHIKTKTISTKEIASGAKVVGDFEITGTLSGGNVSGDNLGNHIATQTVSGADLKFTGDISGAFVYGDGSGLTNLPAGTVLLDDLGNPSGDTAFNMAAKQLKFSWTNPTPSDGAMELEANGGFTGDILHIHQHTGNPGAGTHLIHMEADDADVVPLFISGAHLLSIDANQMISGASLFTSGVVSGANAVWDKDNLNITALSGAHSDLSGAYNTHATDSIDPHGVTLSQNSLSGSHISGGNIFVTNDFTTESGAYVANVVYGASATPPTASTFTRGTVYLQYTV